MGMPAVKKKEEVLTDLGERALSLCQRLDDKFPSLEIGLVEKKEGIAISFLMMDVMFSCTLVLFPDIAIVLFGNNAEKNRQEEIFAMVAEFWQVRYNCSLDEEQTLPMWIWKRAFDLTWKDKISKSVICFYEPKTL